MTIGEKRYPTRGFAHPTFTKERQREVASKGGRAAHQQGVAHEWNKTEARAAGRKGGMARAKSRPARESFAEMDARIRKAMQAEAEDESWRTNGEKR